MRTLTSGAIALLFTACAGTASPGDGASGVSVSIQPAEVHLATGETRQFTAKVSGSDDTRVIWSTDGKVDGASVTQDGMYTAPGTAGTYHVFVASSVDRTATDFATVTVTAEVPPEVEISVHPTEASMKPGATLQLSATVTGSDDTSVAWSVSEGAAGGQVSESGLYTAPASSGTFHVVATSVADSGKSATAEITVDPDVVPTVVVTVDPTTATLELGGRQQFTATVSGTDQTAVTWSVEEGEAGGSVDGNGLYSAPQVSGLYHVVATSVADAGKSASAQVTVRPKPVESDIDMSILPADRRDVWNPGIPGGIPTDRAVFRTLSSLPTDGTGDASGEINQALIDAGAAYDASGKIQEVVLPAGTIRVAQTIRLARSGVVLRGQGMDRTRLRYDGNGVAVHLGKNDWTTYSSAYGPFNLQADGVRGTDEIVLSNADAANVQEGDILCIDEEDDHSFVDMGDAIYLKRNGTQGDTHGPGLREAGKWRSVTSIIRIKSKTPGATSTTFKLHEPLHMSFRTAQYAQVFHIATSRPPYDGIHHAGLENLYFTGGTLNTNNVAFCWIDGVEVDGNPGTPNVGNYANQAGITGRSVELFHAYRCEIRGSYVHHTRYINQGGGAYLVAIDSYTSESLVEDNIILFGNKPIEAGITGGGNVIAYNYVDNARTDHPSWQEGAIDLNHSAFPHSFLVEGNWTTNIVADTTHGNSGWHVAFRNYATGRNSHPLYGWYPYQSAPDGAYMRAAGADGFTRETTFVGNVLTTDPGGTFVIDDLSSSTNAPAIWRVGWGAHGDGGAHDDGTTRRLMYRHANWDSVTGKVEWDQGNAVHDLPDSLYLKAKPAFFGDHDWPWVDPTGATAGDRVKVLPAKERYDAMTK